MFLKKLTVSGFKSFADKVVLNFDTGITGIVGPNGSGKSNVIDAVRWVMGEQNARNLRGEKATDIIFAGSDKRKALTIAEVTLTFDNSDFSDACPPEFKHEPEINITRKLYIDGEREYFINRKECRLKDIVQFFALTGLGGRSYSMIQQGQVDRILNAKPEDVREILEEAAGTLVYKQRKEETQKKLEETKLNLSRVDDILQEVVKQQASLQGQVEKAQAWKQIQDELRHEELSFFGHNAKFFSDKIKEINELLARETQKEVEQISSKASLESRYEELQSVLNESDPEMMRLNEELTTTREMIARYESTIQTSLSRAQENIKRLTDLKSEVQEENDHLIAVEKDFEASTQQVSQLEQEARNLRDLIQSFQDDVDLEEESGRVLKNKLEDFQDEIQNLNRLIDSNKIRKENLNLETQKTLTRQKGFESRIELIKREVQDTNLILGDIEGKLSGFKSGLDNEIKQKHDNETQLAGAYQELKNLNNSKEALKETYLNLKAKLLSIQEVESQTVDVLQSYTTLKKNNVDLDAYVLGVFAQFLKFNDHASELPLKLMTAFEKWSERLVVQDTESLNQLIRYVQKLSQSKSQIGNIPCVLLNSANSQNASSQEIADFVKKYELESLRQFVEIEATSGENTKKQILTLVDQIYFTSGLSLHEKLFEQIPRGMMILTSQGLWFTSSQDILITTTVSGGFLSRKADKEHIDQQIKESEHGLSHLQTAIDTQEQIIQTSRQVLGELDQVLQGQNKHVYEMMTEAQSVRQAAAHKNDLLATEEKNLLETQNTLTQISAEIENLDKVCLSLEDEKIKVEEEKSSLEETVMDGQEKKSEMMRMHQQRQTDLARMEAKAQGLRDNHKHLKTQIDLVQNKLSRRYEEQANLEQDIETLKSSHARAQIEIEHQVKLREELNEQILTKRNENQSVHEELRVLEGKLKDVRELHSKMQKVVSEKNIELERLKLGLESFSTQSLEKYHVDISTHVFEFNPDYPTDKKNKLIQSLRGKLEAIGPVNLMAMEEYETLHKRQEFITTQKNEVLSSIEVLTQATLEIELTSKEKFSQIFVRVNEEFGKLFPILFPNGEAHLDLTNPEDPLAGGVEIMVRLPGKKQQRMNLFSGGEKALTAISLIFALLKTKPTPFCFLDEVDAPLDEANVGRYNRVLEALSVQFQFIVITHNRRTMEVLDTLYGVTMQEGGVSSVVGVDMKKDLPAHLKKAFKETPKESAALAVPPSDEGGRIEGASAF